MSKRKLLLLFLLSNQSFIFGRDVVIPNNQGTARVVVEEDRLRVELSGKKDAMEPQKLWDKQSVAVLWSPSGKTVCVTEDVKRGSNYCVLQVQDQTVVELETPGALLLDAPVPEGFRGGRFHYLQPLRWLDEEHLEVTVDVNFDATANEDVSRWRRGVLTLILKEGTVLDGGTKWEPNVTDETQH